MASVNPNSKPLNSLAQALIQQGLCSEEVVARAVQDAQQQHTTLVALLVRNGVVDPKRLMRSLSERYGLSMLDLDAVALDDEVSGLLDRKLIRRYHALPLSKRCKHLYLAVSDPTDFSAFDDIKFNTGLQVMPVVVEEDKLNRLIEGLLGQMEGNIADLIGNGSFNATLESEEDAEVSLDQMASGGDDAPVVKFVQHLLLDSIQRGASDVHLEPYEKSFRVRYRIDGILQEIIQPPLGLREGITSRLKILARLDISERRIPQDGRLRVRLSKERAIDFRISFLPTLYGEKIVLRLLDPASARVGIDKLGFFPEQQAAFLEAIHRPYGMVLVTGPTGSGKTVTLYTALNILNTPGVNISTAEDPVEINLHGINQVNVNDKIGMGFSTALRAFLRQDPDIIMVGEIRDLETAEISVKAAQTGHMVLSTLHTNDAPQTLTRLENMGVPTFNIASAVQLVLAQRLARRLCEHCKKPTSIPEPAMLEAGFSKEQLKGWRPYTADGCEKCNKTGYKGRVGLYQVMPISEVMRNMILEGKTAADLARQAAAEGILTLRQSGLRRVMDGTTSLQEVTRVTNL
ncbi:MAG: type IV-A pilus assembly ATPase PilB [Pseudomonadota bacterium]|uniref:type IV-A pilus assembly ATPase PilB n=1 Tax=Thermithiobacillus tepidarius TaxID=929 RepID=UPI00041C0CEA|nr:type IV-A pilus assembly ATPase PilB [Thermithiobacillus tepidarius]